ncbi:MAG: hypothetical protein U0790_26165 [Isosphaeraceae bacterium]
MKGAFRLALCMSASLIVQIHAGTCRADNAVVQWSDTSLECVRQSRLGPPMTARALGIFHTCIYDAWAAYDSVAVGTQLGAELRRPPAERTEANKTKAVSFAAYHALLDLFPALSGLITEQLTSLGYDPSDQSTAATVGTECALAVTTFRHGDGSNQLGDLHAGAYTDYTGYAPVNTPDQINDPNRWQPLRFSNGQGGFVTPGFIAPHWYLVKPFALQSGAQFRPGPPALFGESKYIEQAEEMLRISANLTAKQKAIAEYWADGPRSELPPGHWLLFSQFVSRRDHHDLDQDVKMFFLVANAVMDAGIAAWDAKRYYDSERPITAVRFLYSGTPVLAWAGPYKGTQWIDGGDWFPYQPLTFITPPFAEYVSGHSTFSTAAAEVLKRFTGSDRFFHKVVVEAGSSKVEPGARPPGRRALLADLHLRGQRGRLSRRYGGIHSGGGRHRGPQPGRQSGAAVWGEGTDLFQGDGRQ